MPLIFSEIGKESIVKKINYSPEIKNHLENLGFVVGSTVSVVSMSCGNIIVRVKDTKIALSMDLARKIMI